MTPTERNAALVAAEAGLLLIDALEGLTSPCATDGALNDSPSAEPGGLRGGASHTPAPQGHGEKSSGGLSASCGAAASRAVPGGHPFHRPGNAGGSDSGHDAISGADQAALVGAGFQPDRPLSATAHSANARGPG